jgi:hypothetical protein
MLSEAEKEQQLRELKARFESATPETRKEVPRRSPFLPRSPRALIALAIAAVLVLSATAGWLRF